ncbi:serine threonine tyrosine-interacting 1 [Brachionus plicatilis]|uniref:Serine threonine tyrosine-interacting 1 n=1 Tax=Brachionus plicatilis TaxID=10195 RepID=A0A3M7TB69_BRAPC|nr:serine threonine tyrosine-interacting 1 [Brachionus plicatilis]
MFGPNIELIECQELYNLLNEGIEFARLSDPNYLYLIDCRERSDYNEGHIICAKHMKKDPNSEEFRLLYEPELECRNTVITYDSNTSSLQDKGAAVKCAKLLSESGSKNSVKILKGGYETFSRLYPFLRTQQIIYMPRELDQLKTYPSEIIPGLLYLGNLRHATELYIRKDLKIKSFVDCSSSETTE